MKHQQILNVTVKPAGALGLSEEFYPRLNKDGRITIVKLTLEIIQGKLESLVDYALQIDLEPAEVCRTELKPFLTIFGTHMSASQNSLN
jgi:hypothetical protein